MYLGKETSISRRSTAMGPQQLSIIIGVCVPVFGILCIILAVVLWRIRSRKAEERREANEIPEKLRITPYNLPTPQIFQPAASILEPSTPAPITPPTALTTTSSGPATVERSPSHYRTWRTAAAAKAFGQSGYYGDRDSIGEKGPKLQARSAQSAGNDMTDLISLLNSRRVDNGLSPQTTYELRGKVMRPISVDSLSAPTIVASQSGSKEFDSLKGGHRKDVSMDKGMEEGYASEGSVPSLLRKPKYNPVTGAPMIPSIYFGQPFDVESEDERPGREHAQFGSGTTSRRPSQRAPSTLSRSRTQTSTVGRSVPNLALLQAPIEEDLGARIQEDVRPVSTYTMASVAPTASVYPESRTSAETADRPPLPSRAIKEARTGWI